MSKIAQSDKHVYADYAAFSPVDQEVLSAMIPYYQGTFGNPSSLHALGRHAAHALRQARERVASTLAAHAEGVIFTGSGTEANALAIEGIARAYKSRGMHIVVSAIEHPSILEAAQAMEKEGFRVSLAPVRPDGTLDLDACMSLITEETILVSVMYVNNEIGTVQPLEELRRRMDGLDRRVRPLLHTDACQAANLFSLPGIVRHADLVTLNSTKVSGPAGVGLLYRKQSVKLDPVLRGGGQEWGARAGTENLPAIVGFSLALAKAQASHESEYERLSLLRMRFMDGLRMKIPGIVIHGESGPQSPSIVHATVPSIEGEAMLLLLDAKGICASTGSACASMKLRASHVLTAVGHDPDIIHGSLRFSFGTGTSAEDIDLILRAFPVVTERLCSMTAHKLQLP
jgi:cysteine desulfurase